MSWDDLESSLNEGPAFYVQAPDGKREWPELDRQAVFFRSLRFMAPGIYAYPIPNAGKRNPAKARREGITAGVFDVDVNWQQLRAQVEFKGYDARGRAGALSQAQIDHGNRMTRLGWPVACFFCPYAAVEWLRDQGFPVHGRIAA